MMVGSFKTVFSSVLDASSIGSMAGDWHEDVVNKLIDLYGEEGSLPIITYLSMSQDHRDHQSSGVWKMLHALLTKDEVSGCRNKSRSFLGLGIFFQNLLPPTFPYF